MHKNKYIQKYIHTCSFVVLESYLRYTYIHTFKFVRHLFSLRRRTAESVRGWRRAILRIGLGHLRRGRRVVLPGRPDLTAADTLGIVAMTYVLLCAYIHIYSLLVSLQSITKNKESNFLLPSLSYIISSEKINILKTIFNNNVGY